jgi:hypothetical protein
MSDEATKLRPECHGRLETVFPMGADGLRHTPPGCLECEVKTECLRRAVGGKEGLAVREERLARAWRAGSVGFLGRWAELKDLRRRRGRPGLWAGFWRRLRGRRD